MVALMDFDAKAKKKKAKQAEKLKRKQLSDAKVTDIYPVDGITSEGYLKISYGSHHVLAEVFDIKKYDLEKLPLEKANAIEDAATRLFGEYQGSIKEIFRNFPERNKQQQGYFRRLMTRTNDLTRLSWIEDQINILVYLEQTYSKLGSWQLIYGDSVQELEANIKKLEKYKEIFGFYPVNVSDKALLFKLINNPGGLINGEKETE